MSRLDQLVAGLWVTLGLSLATILLGLLLGVAGALALRGSAPWRGAARCWVETVRNTPLLAQLFFVYFGLPALGLRLDATAAALVALVVNLGAYASEIIRGGIDAVPRGQVDAGLALGLRRRQVFLLVVLKPAVRIMFPALASQFTLVMLATSVVSQIGVEDLFHQGSLIDSATYRSFEVYVVVCGMYLALALALRLGFALLYVAVLGGAPPLRAQVMETP